MKIIKYETMTESNCGTEEKPNIVQIFTPIEIRCKEEHLTANIEIAKKEAYNGEYTIEDDGVEEVITPTQLDRIESQVAYLAMMTGNEDILEV